MRIHLDELVWLLKAANIRVEAAREITNIFYSYTV